MHIKQTGQIINPYFYKLILITSHMRKHNTLSMHCIPRISPAPFHQKFLAYPANVFLQRTR